MNVAYELYITYTSPSCTLRPTWWKCYNFFCMIYFNIYHNYNMYVCTDMNVYVFIFIYIWMNYSYKCSYLHQRVYQERGKLSYLEIHQVYNDKIPIGHDKIWLNKVVHPRDHTCSAIWHVGHVWQQVVQLLNWHYAKHPQRDLQKKMKFVEKHEFM